MRPQWKHPDSPYADGLEPDRLYEGPVQQEALARLNYLVERRRHLGLLIGPSGTGKSLLLDVFARQLSRQGTPVAVVKLIGVDLREMLWQIATGWGISVRQCDDTFRLWRAVTDRVVEYRLRQIGCVLLLDDADEAASALSDDIIRLLQYDPTSDSPLTVVASAQPEQIVRLNARLLQIASLRVDLSAWNQQETIGFLKTALARSGGRTEFDESALARLHTLSQGVPRHVRQLADLALTAGAGQRIQRIDGETVQSVYEELGII